MGILSKAAGKIPGCSKVVGISSVVGAAKLAIACGKARGHDHDHDSLPKARCLIIALPLAMAICMAARLPVELPHSRIRHRRCVSRTRGRHMAMGRHKPHWQSSYDGRTARRAIARCNSRAHVHVQTMAHSSCIMASTGFNQLHGASGPIRLAMAMACWRRI